MAKQANTLYIGCRIPTGLICRIPNDIKLYFERLNKGDRVDNLPGKEVKIAGINSNREVQNTGILAGNYGITKLQGKDAEAFQAWLEMNKGNPIVENKLVWVTASKNDTAKEGKQLSKDTTGLEGLDVKKEENRQRDANGSMQTAEAMSHDEVNEVTGNNG